MYYYCKTSSNIGLGQLPLHLHPISLNFDVKPHHIYETGINLHDYVLQEVTRLTKAMKDPKFKEMFLDYAKEISDPTNKQVACPPYGPRI